MRPLSLIIATCSGSSVEGPTVVYKNKELINLEYGKAKYGTFKYGKYELPTNEGGALNQEVKYRIRSINSSKTESSIIENTSIDFPTNNKPSAVRIRSDKSDFVTQQNEHINGNIYRIRVCSVIDNIKSSWIESVVGTVKLKEGD
jgi:hypothetical protein